MTNFPRMMAFVMETQKETKMIQDIERINMMLCEMANDGILEPIDEKNCHPMDWAEVVGISDEIFDEIYPEPEYSF